MQTLPGKIFRKRQKRRASTPKGNAPAVLFYTVPWQALFPGTAKGERLGDAPQAALNRHLFRKVWHSVPLLEETSPQQQPTQTLEASQRFWLLYAHPFTRHWMSVSTVGFWPIAFCAPP